MYKIGFSCKDVTPPVGSPMAGHVGDKKSKGIADPLYAKAMSINDHTNIIVFVSVDVLFIDMATIQEIKDRVHQYIGSNSLSIYCSSTHTHSGPMTTGLFGRDGQDEYVEFMIAQVVDAIVESIHCAEDMELYISKTRVSHIAFCERIIMRGGRIETHPFRYDPDIIAPESVVDDELYVVSAVKDGITKGMYVNFANHPQVMERENPMISADYPGSMEKQLKSKLGNELVMLFGLGACGNVCPVNAMSNENIEIGEQYKNYVGKLMADAAIKSLDSKEKVTGRIEIINSCIKLKRREISRERIELAKEYLENYEPVEAPICSNYGVEEIGGDKISLGEFLDHPYWKNQEYIDILKLDELNKQSLYEQIEINGLAFGDTLSIITTPFEMFCDTAIDIKTYSAFNNTIVLELCNGSAGYLPTEQAFHRSGGYETLTLVSSRFAENSCRAVKDEAIHILDKLYTGGPEN